MFTGDADGKLTFDGACTYAWDAENRLIGVTPYDPDASSRKVTCAYDAQGRRIRKSAYAWDPTAGGGAGAWMTTPALDRAFVYDGWLLLMELDGLNSDAVLRRYTWGLDLSGQSGSPGIAGVHGAGGIGATGKAGESIGGRSGLFGTATSWAVRSHK